MINYYFKEKLDDKSCVVLDEYKKGSWVYVESPSPEEITRLAKDFSLDEDVLTDVLDENEMPRIERSDGNAYIFTRHPYTDDDLRITTSPVLLVLTKETLITLFPQRFSRIDRLAQGRVEFSTKNHMSAMLQILDEIDDEYEAKLNSISRQIKSIRSRLRVEEIRNKDFVDFVLIEDILNEFMTALSPTNAILRRLMIGKQYKLSEEHEDLLEDLLLNNEQSIGGCRSSLKTIVNIREAYSTIMTNNLNRVMRLLTVLTVIISIPTLITSMYGMNVSLPFQDNQGAFVLVMAMSLVSSLALLLLFRIQKWL